MSCSIQNGKFYAPNGKESILYKNLEKEVGAERAKELFITAYTKTFNEKVIQPTINSYRERVKNLLPIRKDVEFRQTDVNNVKTTHLYLGKQKIGRIQFENYKDGVKIKSVLVNEKGKGFETALYNKLILDNLNQGLSIYSDQYRTEDADRIWESLKNKGLTNGKVIKAISEDFDANGEISAEKVLEYFENTQSSAEPLKPTEIVAIKQSINQDIEDLYDTMREAFYKGNIFSPTQKSLKASGIYSDYEIGKILGDINLQATIYSTIQSLKQEENTISVEQFGKEEFKTNTNKLNGIGKLEATNPLKEENLYIEENGGLDYVEDQRIPLDKYKSIPVLNESGEAVQTEMLYEKAVKVVESQSLFDALETAISAPLTLDITKLENAITEKLKDYGIDISTLSRVDYPILFEYLKDPSIENTISLEKVMGFEREAKQKVVDISDKNRSYVYMETNKTEQQLFNELSLVQTNNSNVYHKVNKVDEQGLRDIISQQKTEEVEEIPILDFIKGKEAENYIKYNGIFSKTTTGTSYDDVFEDKNDGKYGYFFFYKKEKARVEMMSPDEYLKRVRDGFGTERDENITPQSKENILKGIEKKEKIDMPFLNYIDGRFNQEGRNRASLAKERGEKLIPVMILNTVSFRDLESVSEDMLDNLTDKYNFNSKDKLLNAVVDKYKLHRDAKRYIETEILENYTYLKERSKPEYGEVKPMDSTTPEYKLYKEYYGYKTPQITEELVSGDFTGDLEYLQNEFVADFAIEKLKNPNKFNENFKITDKDIELISNDTLTIETVKAHIKENVELGKEMGEYSLISKNIPALVDGQKASPRVEAINNYKNIPQATGKIIRVNDNILATVTETKPYVMQGNALFELQEKDNNLNFYAKLEKSENLNYYNLTPSSPITINTSEYKFLQIKEDVTPKIKKLAKKDELWDNFECK